MESELKRVSLERFSERVEYMQEGETDSVMPYCREAREYCTKRVTS